MDIKRTQKKDRNMKKGDFLEISRNTLLFKMNREKGKWLKKLKFWKLMIKNSKKFLKVPIPAEYRTDLKVH